MKNKFSKNIEKNNKYRRNNEESYFYGVVKMEEIEPEKETQIKIGMNFEKPARITKVENVKLLIKDDTHETYANGLTVLHTSPMEFRLNFYDVSFGDEDGPIGIVKSTIIVPPTLIRQIIKALETNLKNYEDSFGKIQEIEVKKEKLAKIDELKGIVKEKQE